jgi:protein transport protein DSL1/ZW10
MTTLRRDITTHYLEFLLSQAATLEFSTIPSIAGVVEYKLTLFPAPQHSQPLRSRIDNVATVLTFLNDHLFSHLPSRAAFPISLSKPLTHAMLDKFLVSSLPSSAEELPAFLDVVKHAVQFEETYVHGILGDVNGTNDIKTWADSVALHYEKKRRMQILERARAVIIRDDDGTSFHAEVSVVHDVSPSEEKYAPKPNPEKLNSPEDSAWGFDDEESADAVAGSEEDSWNFGDDVDLEPAAEVQPEPSSAVSAPLEDDPEDAWKWNDEEELPPADDEDASTDSSAWDDPWGDNAEAAPPSPKVPKAATRLERLTNKGKAKETTSAVQSLAPVPSSKPAVKSPVQTPSQPALLAQRETYLVSGRVKELLWLVEDVVREAAELASSNVLQRPSTSSTSQVGGVISQTAALVLDLYRGLYPVAATTSLETTKGAICFSNDCTWLGGELGPVIAQPGLYATTMAKLEEARERLKALAECWYDETIVSRAFTL